jgi:hypothetical protein
MTRKPVPDPTPVLERLAAAPDPDAALAGGLLFHGTCEAFDLPPRGGGYDGLVWTADLPTVAQAYIPRSGTQMLVSEPSPWRLGERVVPEPHGAWTLIARQMTGLEPDVELDRHRMLRSWAVPKGWPTYGEAAEWVRSLGYSLADARSSWLSVRNVEGADLIVPADWKMPGRLLVTLPDGLRLADLRRSLDGDLTDLEYHDHAGFAAARAAGYDGVVINDFVQTREWGNVGHVSRGLFPEAAARLPWAEAPAERFEWGERMAERSTPAFDALHAAASVVPAPR